MGGQEEEEEADIGVNFLTAMSDYFKLKPIEAVILLHDISNSLTSAVNDREDLRRDLGFSAGQLRVLAHTLWIYDHLSVIQKIVTSPDTQKNVIEAMMWSAKAYYMLRSGEPIAIVDVMHFIDKAIANLLKVIEAIVVEANKSF